jgi:hypothetical protein
MRICSISTARRAAARVGRAVLCLALCLGAGGRILGQTTEAPLLDPPIFASQPYDVPGELPIHIAEQPPPESLVPDGEPDWCPSPCPPSQWKADVGYVPTTLFHNNDHMHTAVRLDVEHDDPSGLGRSAHLWLFHQGFGRDDVSFATFHYDFDKQVRIGQGELLLGAGLAAAYVNEDFGRDDSQFFGAGGSISGSGFYPLLCSERTTLGGVGRARIALLGGFFHDRHGLSVDRDSLLLIDEFAWGLELRHQYGQQPGDYWFIDVEREIQNWGGAIQLPYIAGTTFQGLALNFGVAW